MGIGMAWGSALLTMALVAGPPSPSTAEQAPQKPGPLDFELSGIVVTPTVTGPTVGPDIGVAIGRDRVHARVGMQVVGGPDRRVSTLGHRVGEIVETGTLHLCGARQRDGFRVRLCGGGQLGVTHLRYVGFATRGRRVVPWGAFSGFGDVAIPLGRRSGLYRERLGLLLQGGAMVPVLGPALVIDDGAGGRLAGRRPARVGATFGAGLRVSLR